MQQQQQSLGCFSFLLGLLGVILCGMTTLTQATAGPQPDPYLWLEEVEGTQSLQWVNQQNARTLSVLEADPLFGELKKDLEDLYYAKDRVPFSNAGNGYFWNFWQDAQNPHGIWRRTTEVEYRKDQPQWEIVLDLDDLSRSENRNWVFKGIVRLTPQSDRVFVSLSDGGKDAALMREFDVRTKRFVAGGFEIPEAKSDLHGLSEDAVLVGTDFGPGSLTDSGYPRVLKYWKRGQPLAQAQTLFEGRASDMGVSAFAVGGPNERTHLLRRALDFFNADYFVLGGDLKLRQLPFPKTASVVGFKEGYFYLQLRDELSLVERRYPAGAVVRVSAAAQGMEGAELVFKPQPRQSIEEVQVGPQGVFVSLLNNVRSQILRLERNAYGEWSQRVLPFPDTGMIAFSPRSENDPQRPALLTYQDHLTPSSQYLVRDQDGSYALDLLKRAPARFDASPFEVVQYFAQSKDGERVPYFVLKRKDLVLNGKNPTILYGYGGFEIALTPHYSGVIGKLWLERGGVYVVANIRGGGEFGPQWHQAALKKNRQRAFDDFAAVAENLIARGVTSPSHLGIQGGSNGGLLVSTVMVQRPELFRAVLSQVPLTDMQRFSQMLAGASWMGEYGDPELADECAALLQYSPYHNVKGGTRYPEILFTTSTKDDRVHPAHARKMAAKMLDQGHSVLYYENINGGHAGSANFDESIRMGTLEYTYFWRKLK